MKKTRESDRRNVVGPRVRQLRLAAVPAVSQEDLSGRLAGLGVSLDQGAISRIESQTRYVMDYEAEAIAKALHVPTAALFDSNKQLKTRSSAAGD